MSDKPTVASLTALVASLTLRVEALEKRTLRTPKRRTYAPDTTIAATPKPSHDAPFAERVAWAKAESKRTGCSVAMP
jgi:hypothetical protein